MAKFDFTTLQDKYQTALALPAKERRKQGRTVGHIAMELEKSGQLLTAEEMQLAIQALAMGASSHSYPQRFQMSRTRLMKARREILGQSEPVIDTEKVKTLDVDAGCLFVSDAALPDEVWYRTDAPFHQILNTHGFYCVGLGGDGLMKTRVRVHSDGPCEPQSKEFRRLKEATTEARLSVTSGELVVSGGGAKDLRLSLAAGDYRVCAFGLGMGRSPECLILLSPLNGAPPLALSEVPELQI